MNAGLESLGRVRLQATLLLVAVFLIGALSGLAFERVRGSRPYLPPPHAGRERPGRGIPPEMKEELELTAEQEKQILEILERYRPRMESIIQESFPRMRAVTDSVRAEVRRGLTAEQQEIFDRIQPPFVRDGGAPPFVTDPLPGWRRPPPGPGGRPGPPRDGGPPRDEGQPRVDDRPRGDGPPPEGDGGEPPESDPPSGR